MAVNTALMESEQPPVGTFAETLRALLHENNLSQAELARRIGLSPQAVSGWFAGGNTPTRESVEKVEDELAVEPRGLLLTAAGYSIDGDLEGPTVESLLRSDPRFDPEDRRVILRIIRLAVERHSSQP